MSTIEHTVTLTKMGTKNCNERYTYNEPGTVIGIAYQIFCTYAKEFPKDQKKVMRTFILQEGGQLYKFEGERKSTKSKEGKYIFKYNVKAIK